MRIDPTTGEMVAHECEGCHRLETKVAGLRRELEAAQDGLTNALTQIKALKTQNENRRENHRRRKEVEAIHRDWQQVCDKPKSHLTNDRFDVIVAGLNAGYTAEHFHLASVGAKYANPWRPRPGEGPMLEIAVFAKGRHIETFANAGYRHLKANPPRLEVVPDPKPRREYGRRPIDTVLDALPAACDVRENYNGTGFRAKCPVHDGTSWALSITTVDGINGEMVLMRCFAGCDTSEVLDAIGLGFADLFSSSVELEAGGCRARSRPRGVPLHLIRTMQQFVEKAAA